MYLLHTNRQKVCSCVHLCQSNMLQMIVIHELQVFKTVTAEAVTFLELADLLGQEISSPVLDPEFASVEGKRR